MLFSERMGIKSAKILQIDTMDEDLRNSLWNVFYIHYFDYETDTVWVIKTYTYYCELLSLFINLQINYFKKPIDELESLRAEYNPEKLIASFKNLFLKLKWFELYEFVEFIVQNFEIVEININFKNQCNIVLEKEKSAYKFIDKQIVPISSEIEVQEIEQSLETSQNDKFKFINNHLNQAIELFKNRENPDYKNTIKEAISAVEGLCREITGESTLGDALNKIDDKIQINPQFKEGLRKIYAFTNGKEGIRHAQMLDSNIGFDEAKFMLVFCSTFINYLIAKWTDSSLRSE